jgi:hypothetical protein
LAKKLLSDLHIRGGTYVISNKTIIDYKDGMGEDDCFLLKKARHGLKLCMACHSSDDVQETLGLLTIGCNIEVQTAYRDNAAWLLFGHVHA